jgi:putative endonuclease
VLARNVWAGRYEIDLVVRRGHRVAFVEVKERGVGSWGAAAEAVDAEKQRRLRQAAEVWLASRRDLAECVKSFEVVALDGGRLERIERAF